MSEAEKTEYDKYLDKLEKEGRERFDKYADDLCCSTCKEKTEKIHYGIFYSAIHIYTYTCSKCNTQLKVMHDSAWRENLIHKWILPNIEIPEEAIPVVEALRKIEGSSAKYLMVEYRKNEMQIQAPNYLDFAIENSLGRIPKKKKAEMLVTFHTWVRQQTDPVATLNAIWPE